MTVIRQNILSMIMLKNVKISYGNASFHLAIPEICWVRNLCSYPRGFWKSMYFDRVFYKEIWVVSAEWMATNSLKKELKKGIRNFCISGPFKSIVARYLMYFERIRVNSGYDIVRQVQDNKSSSDGLGNSFLDYWQISKNLYRFEISFVE